MSWGDPGTGNGQFNIPHGIAISQDDTVYIADRENNRIQIFDQNGNYLRKIEGVCRPNCLCIDSDNFIYVTELGNQIANKWILKTLYSNVQLSCVSILDLQGNLLSRLGGSEGWLPGNFLAAHGICIDSKGDLYVGEVIWTANGGKSPVDGCHNLQKLERFKTIYEDSSIEELSKKAMENRVAKKKLQT